ncbi:vacuolar iron transporter Ccc1 [Ophiocordyceps camponoti-floridani]|uniref:Vacuolar iron transporter Ccc1 n=1 Tax=Ophiocordyceps camponoti-floridani TaxID=2030778 RepID=A0A8H4VDT5_9HYPO|nr:vacuolar iron transporter Ccc1 [Ophiocordyceps camponoti-floridani]
MTPTRPRFLSGFTLGFSDGLTVPFALTAGLGSLGRADTVVYAGLAEMCAGSISMGIGGYLSAVDDAPVSSNGLDGERGVMLMASDEQLDIMSRDADEDELLVRRYLEPLSLSDSTVNAIFEALRCSPNSLSRAARQLHPKHTFTSQPTPRSSPILVGLSISLGYLTGGIVPLFPYFFAPTVGQGLGWSVGLCLVALMAFGFIKCWVMGAGYGNRDSNTEQPIEDAAMPRMGLFRTAVGKKNNIAASMGQTRDPVERRLREARSEGRDLMAELGLQRAGNGNKDLNTEQPNGHAAMPRMGLFKTAFGKRNNVAASKDNQTASPLSIPKKRETNHRAKRLEDNMKDELVLMATEVLIKECVLDKNDEFWNKLVGEDDGSLDYILGKRRLQSEQEDGDGDDEGGEEEDGEDRPCKARRV